MLELMGGVSPNKNAVIGPYTYLDEGSYGNYSDLYQALGLSGGNVTSSQAFLRYYSQAEKKNCIMPKVAVAVNVSFNSLMAVGLVEGRKVNFAGKEYFARLIRGANTLPVDAMQQVADSTIYPAGAIFNFCEFNLLFNPIISMSGTSPEGMVYGEQAKFSPAALGFGSARSGNSTICANYNASNVLLRGSTDHRFAAMRGRGGTSTYWSFRPILFEV